MRFVGQDNKLIFDVHATQFNTGVIYYVGLGPAMPHGDAIDGASTYFYDLGSESARNQHSQIVMAALKPFINSHMAEGFSESDPVIRPLPEKAITEEFLALRPDNSLTVRYDTDGTVSLTMKGHENRMPSEQTIVFGNIEDMSLAPAQRAFMAALIDLALAGAPKLGPAPVLPFGRSRVSIAGTGPA